MALNESDSKEEDYSDSESEEFYKLHLENVKKIKKRFLKKESLFSHCFISPVDHFLCLCFGTLQPDLQVKEKNLSSSSSSEEAKVKNRSSH